MSSEDIKKANFYRVIFLAICFMTLFTAYASHQTLVGQIYAQLGFGRLGQICLVTVFVCFTLSSMVATHFIKQISARTGLFIGTAGHASLIFAGVLTTFCTKYDYESGVCSSSFIFAFNIFCAFCVGVGAAFLWICQALYVNACADSHTKGIYNGVFFSICQSSQIWSSMLATYILGSTDQFTFYSILSLFAIAAIVMLGFVKSPVQNELQDEKVEEPTGTLRDAIESFGQVIGKKKCYWFFAGVFFSGIALGCYFGYLANAITTTVDSTNTNVINQSIGYVLIVLAAGQISAGFSIGRLADTYDKIKVFTATMFIHEAALFTMLLAILFKSYTLGLICGLLWGYGDTSIQTMINALIGSMFNGRKEIFSAYRVFQSAGITFSILMGVILPSDMPIFYLMIVAGSMPFFHNLYYRYMPSNTLKSQDFLLEEENRIMVELKNI